MIGCLLSLRDVYIKMTYWDVWVLWQRLAVKRLTDIGMGVLTPLAEQLAKPLPHAMALATLDEISSGVHKELPAGNPCKIVLQFSPVRKMLIVDGEIHLLLSTLRMGQIRCELSDFC